MLSGTDTGSFIAADLVCMVKPLETVKEAAAFCTTVQNIVDHLNGLPHAAPIHAAPSSSESSESGSEEMETEELEELEAAEAPMSA